MKNFVPMDGSRLRKKHNLDGKYVILGVASPWSNRKGLADFYKLRTVLPEEYVIILVGLTPAQVESMPAGILGISRTESQQELAEYYSMSDVFVNMTYLDTFPTVNLEALACGTPVITYRTGGSPEAVDEKTGLVVPQGDVNALVAAICQLREKPLSREDCRKRAEVCFDKDKCFQQYIDLYNSILNK